MILGGSIYSVGQATLPAGSNRVRHVPDPALAMIATNELTVEAAL